jgi:hypothetical protein
VRYSELEQRLSQLMDTRKEYAEKAMFALVENNRERFKYHERCIRITDDAITDVRKRMQNLDNESSTRATDPDIPSARQ